MNDPVPNIAVRNRRNVVQRVMAQWAQLHPYNALDIVRLSGPAEPDRLRRAACDVLTELGLGRPVAEPDGLHYRFDPGAAEVAVEAVEALVGATVDVTLAAQAAHELNRPFPEPGPPMRLSMLAAGADHFVVMTYPHWLFDGFAAAHLLVRILARRFGAEPTDGPAPIGRRCPTYREAFAGRFDFDRAVGMIRRTVHDLSRFRRCHCPYWGDRHDLRVDVLFPAFPDDLLECLTAAARSRQATVNDILLAALAEAAAANTPDRLRYGSRRDLALHSIADLRPLAPARLGSRAGLYLSHFPVMCRSAATRDFAGLLRHIRIQTARVKSTRSYVGGLLVPAALDLLWPRLRPEARAVYAANQMPAVAGITNIRLPPAWFAGGLMPRVLGWRRAAPTGPATPLVVAVTTANGRLSLGVTARVAGFPPDVRDAVIDGFRRRLASL